MDMKQLGKKIKIYREHLHLSQEEFAHRAFISGSYVSRLELGKVQSPTKETLECIARAIGISTEMLLSIGKAETGLLEDSAEYHAYLSYKSRMDALPDARRCQLMKIIDLVLSME